MRIDATHRKWFFASLGIAGAATAVYIPYALTSAHGPRGSSAVGLTFGIIGSAFMLFAGLLGARNRVPVWRLGRAQTWMRGHLWLGLLSLPLILFHGGFHFGGTLTTVLMWLLIVVVTSGVVGAALQHYLPRTVTADVPMETIFEEIASVRAQLRREADQLVATVCGPLGTAAADIRADTTGENEELTDAVALSADEGAPLRRFYLSEMRPFLEDPRDKRAVLADPQKASAAFEQLRTLLPPAVHVTVKDLENICEEERQLRRQARLHHLLHDWLLMHIPLSLALLVLGAVHAWMALRF